MSIPQKILASVAVAQSQRYMGELFVKDMPRLSQALADADGSLQVEIVATRVERRAAMVGNIQGQVHLLCQSCDQPYAFSLKTAVDLRLVSSEEEEKQLLKNCEPYWVHDDQLLLHEMIEDEALLALPMLPRCDSCENSVQAAPLTSERGEHSNRENPFAALKKLKF
jgi:uncharacterized protein